MLVDHRDCLVAERTRAQRRLRGTSMKSTPTSRFPSVDSTGWSGSTGSVDVSPAASSRSQTTIARELVGRCRTLTRTIREIERDLETRTTTIAPGLRALPLGPVTAAKLLGEIGPIDRFHTEPSSPATPASPRSRRAAANTDATASTAEATANSTGPDQIAITQARCTRPHTPTWTANRPKAKAAEKPSAASNDSSPAPSTPPSKTRRP